ncbi:MAG: hypothetical protein HUU01_17315 [Saprospiraceae bacterium]|nr:hypothetical protein [Saprospiraceae bacterium]
MPEKKSGPAASMPQDHFSYLDFFTTLNVYGRSLPLNTTRFVASGMPSEAARMR